ncbi:hypothetical protein GF402_06340 [Candidatus Fermentibacteria bacterium]|nr:hypothetical protein [Candidatus Fermentibacteria bacterium]
MHSGELLSQVSRLVTGIGGVTATGEDTFLFSGVMIAEAIRASGSIVMEVRSHPSDALVLVDEYPFCRTIDSVEHSESGWVRFMFFSPPDEMEREALLESVRSAADRVEEEQGRGTDGSE